MQFLSMKLATVNPRLDFNIEGLLPKGVSHRHLTSALTWRDNERDVFSDFCFVILDKSPDFSVSGEFIFSIPVRTGSSSAYLWNTVSGEYRHPVPVSPDTVIQYRHSVPDRYWKHPVPHPVPPLI